MKDYHGNQISFYDCNLDSHYSDLSSGSFQKYCTTYFDDKIFPHQSTFHKNKNDEGWLITPNYTKKYVKCK